MTDEERKAWEESHDLTVLGGPDNIIGVRADVLDPASRELKQRREDEEWLKEQGYCLSAMEEGWAILHGGSNHNVAGHGLTIHAAIEKARREGKE